MYYCPDCGCEFEKAEVYTETHGLASPPFEECRCCPNCGSGGFRLKTSSHCRCCGARLAPGEKEYCSDVCRKRGEEMWSRELKKRKLRRKSSLNRIIAELTEYNQRNHTDYSYGQYVTLIRPHLKGKEPQRKKDGLK